jgi:hypothetical protein
MTEVTPRFKALVRCACGCGEGRPQTKARRDGMHVRGCECRACTAGAHPKAEKRRVGKYARRSGLTQASGSGRRLGYDLSGVVALEETSAVALVDPLRKWWERKGMRDKVARVADQRMVPWGFAASWDGKVQLVVIPADGFAALCFAASGSDLEAAQSIIDALGGIAPIESDPARVSRDYPVKKETKDVDAAIRRERRLWSGESMGEKT